jgi:hypothetical protein
LLFKSDREGADWGCGAGGRGGGRAGGGPNSTLQFFRYIIIKIMSTGKLVIMTCLLLALVSSGTTPSNPVS